MTITISDYLKNKINTAAAELHDGSITIKLPEESLSISLTKDHDGLICVGNVILRDKKIYVLQKK